MSNRPRPLAAAVLAGLTGAVTVAVGAGVGFRHVSKVGLTGTAAAGLLLAAAGLALLAIAGRGAWRSLRGRRRLWLICAVVLLLPMWSVAEGSMLAIAPRTPLGYANPAARGLAFTAVTFRTADGVQLSAWYIPSTNGAAVVTVPGAGSTRSATLPQAVVLARRGFGILMLDPRGQGRSGGRAMDAGWYGEQDISAALDFLRQRPDVLPGKVGALGLSMGGEEVIGAAGGRPDLRAVVAEGATHRTAADRVRYLPGGVAGFIQRGLDRLTYATADLLSPARTPGALHRSIKEARSTQFLLIAAGDAVDETEAATALRTAAPGRVQVWTVEGAEHTRGLATAPASWEARVTAFLRGALDVSAPPVEPDVAAPEQS